LQQNWRRPLEKLVDDINRIRSVSPGLAEAVIDSVALSEMGCPISRETLIALANYHQPNARIPAQLGEIRDDPCWQAVAPLFSFSSKTDHFKFHNEDIPKGLVAAAQHGLLGSRTVGDDAWRRATLQLVIAKGSHFSSSMALNAFIRNSPNLISKGLAVDYMLQMLAAGNRHGLYLRLIVDEILALENHERVDLLLAAAKVAPFDDSFWNAVWKWIQSHYPQKERMSEVLERLYKAGCRAFSILIPLLHNLPSAKARERAKEWLAEPTTSYDVLYHSLDFLGDEAKDDAKRLLANPATDPKVVCRCLDTLGAEAKVDAKRLLADPATDPKVVCRCLDLLGGEAKEDAKRLLAERTDKEVLCRSLALLGEDATEDAKRLLTESKDQEVVCRCLALLGDEAKADAKRFLADSNTHFAVLCRSLDLLGEEAKEDAKRLLANPSTHFAVQCRSLDLLGEEAKGEAKQLLAVSKNKEVLCRCLDLLGNEAESFVVERIRRWHEADHSVLARCFKVAGSTPPAQKLVEEVLINWDERYPHHLRIAALRLSPDKPLRIQRACEVLRNWSHENRSLVNAALIVLWSDHDATTQCCREILERWHQEISYPRERRLPVYDDHIMRAISHPALRSEAVKTAQGMLSAESKSPGLLTDALRRQAESVAAGRWSDREALEERTESGA